MKLSNTLVAAGLLAAVSAAPTAAQTTTDGPGPGSGPGVTSMIVFVPVVAVGGGTAGGGTVTVNGPGGAVQVSAAAAQALNTALSGGTLSPEARSALVESFGGSSNNQAGALVDALVAFGANPSGQTLAAATQAYNNAVNAGPANVPGGLVMVRGVLSGAAYRAGL
ncbi:hypothetical protein Strain138_001737 [Pseudogemmatithrix spongiicola]|uniref:Uncharacterized protein n=1 Tax=Pseudogemmatithrix spongiicola TaxID=3062599 RepID=A0AA49K0T6_9BACT|nr:hypothetical protein Strain138_001737 [Gemmatimonadaceae bacterium 'strain 138']WKW15353.1 hypothetical protein Strain318_001736 [Gemmatimonadaceae bacterium 'strain 318']